MIFPYFKFAQLAILPNWYDNLGEAMDEEARVASMRTSAGWEAGEGGWSSPDGIHETDWADEAGPFQRTPTSPSGSAPPTTTKPWTLASTPSPIPMLRPAPNPPTSRRAQKRSKPQQNK